MEALDDEATAKPTSLGVLDEAMSNPNFPCKPLCSKEL